MRAGPRNALSDVDGLAVGNAEDRQAWTGVTVVLPDDRVTAAVDVRGGAPGSRETDLLNPGNLVQAVDAIVLSGGSVWGLDAAQGVAEWLAARGRGYAAPGAVVPIVPAAILYDLANGGDKAWDTPPYRALGRAAAEAAGPGIALGNAGAGYGAKAGTLKGGLGTASAVDADGLQVAALVAANPVGSPVMPGTSTLWAWPFEQDGEMGGQAPPRTRAGVVEMPTDVAPGTNTTIAVVATNAALDRPALMRVAMMAHDGMARAIHPSHTPFDGDTVFSLATARWGRSGGADPALVGRIGSAAADCLVRAIGRAVWHAETLGRFPALNQDR